MDKKEISEAARILGHASQKHGLYAFEVRGEAALSEPQRSRYLELRDQFNTTPGREEYRVELAAFIAMMIELAKGDIQARAAKGQSIWTSPPVAKMGTYINTLVRLMDNWPKDKPGPATIVELMRGDTDQLAKR